MANPEYDALRAKELREAQNANGNPINLPKDEYFAARNKEFDEAKRNDSGRKPASQIRQDSKRTGLLRREKFEGELLKTIMQHGMETLTQLAIDEGRKSKAINSYLKLNNLRHGDLQFTHVIPVNIPHVTNAECEETFKDYGLQKPFIIDDGNGNVQYIVLNNSQEIHALEKALSQNISPWER